MLGFYPQWTNDRLNFDDAVLASEGDGFDDSDACCLRSEINIPGALLDTCPYPVCPDGEDDDASNNNDNANTPSRRLSQSKEASTSAVAAVPATAAAAPAPSAAKAVSARAVRPERPARWWESKAKTQFVINSMKAQTYTSSAWFREYQLTQQRTNVCVHDEKLDLYVKTSCHGQRDSLVYQVYADPQCSLLIRKTEHALSEAIPAYGRCAQSSVSGDTRYALTVCHNKNGVNFPVNVSPPMVG